MMFQGMDLFTALFIAGIIVSIIVFFIGVFITKWWAGKKGWDDNLKPALILNIFWLIVNIALGWLLMGIIALIINIIVGGWLACKLYDKDEIKDGIIFVIVVLIILFILYLIIAMIIVAIVVIALLGTGGIPGGSSTIG